MKSIVTNGHGPKQAVRQVDPPKVAAIYARVSTTDQADKGYSLPTQIEACQAMARQEGYTVPDTHVFVDDYTGTSLNRPQLTKLRDLVHQRLVHAVIAYDLDRLSRKLAHQLLLSEEFEQAGVALHIVTMPASDKTPETQLLSNVRGIIAEYERSKILERTMRGLRGRAKEGYPPASGIPLGYCYVKHAGKGGHYEINPEEAALVHNIFQWYVQDSMSMHAIAVHLIQEGVPTPWKWRGKGTQGASALRGWHVVSVRNILTNETYTGTFYYGKKQSLPGKSNPDKKTRWRDVPREAWIPIPVPVIIEPALFQDAQAQIQRNTQQSRRNRKHEYLFVAGRLRGGHCGRTMSGFSSRAETRRYRCSHHPYQAHENPHRPRSCLASPVESAVWQAIERLLHNPTLIAEEVERLKQDTSNHQATLARNRHVFDRQMAQCERELKKSWDAYINDAITLDDFKAKKADIDMRRASVEQELARLDEQARLLQQAHFEADSLKAYCARVKQNLNHFTMDEKRLALDALNIVVTWHPGQPLTIQGSIPVDIDSNTS